MLWLSRLIEEGVRFLEATLRSMFDWLKTVPAWWWGVFVAVVLTPLNMVLDWIDAGLVEVINLIVVAADLVDSMEFDQWGSYWSNAAEAAAICNVFAPLGLGFGLLAGLIALWTVCAIIRLVLKIKAIFWAG